ncbi:MAG: alpha/beta hydrolase [Muribaculaceae bacterium]|nr:alpha/beta hydrolase [Muribaculaceae bacterium]
MRIFSFIPAACMAVMAYAGCPSSVNPWKWTSVESPSAGYSPDSLVKQTFVYAVKGCDTLRLDVYYNPTADWTYGERRPAILFSFGGGWEAGARADGAGTHTPFLNIMTRYGYVGIGIDYRLGYLKARKSGRVDDISVGHYLEGKDYTSEVFQTITDAIETGADDIIDATAFVVANADKWNIDPDCVILCGASAGGCNSLAAAFRDLDGAKTGLPEGFRYAGVIAGCAALWYAAPGSPAEAQGDAVAPALADMPGGRPCPVLFIHGDADPLIPFDRLSLPGGLCIDGSAALVRYFAERGWPYVMITGPGCVHSFGGEQFSSGHDFVNRFILDYIVRL